MLIESDIFVALLKKQDWLKASAEKIIQLVEEGTFGVVKISTEIFHELYYVFSEFTDTDVIISNFVKLRALKNVDFIAPTPEIFITATTLMKHYGITSVFDSIYAAQALSSQCKDHTIISTDHIYDKVEGIVRVDPRELLKQYSR